jgi:flagellar basal-body rod protein FlgC
MTFNSIFDIASSGLTAENTRLSTTASNMANANTVSGDKGSVYHPEYPIFQAVQADATAWLDNQYQGGVRLVGVYQNQAEPIAKYDPNHPLADSKGYVYVPNVTYAEEMANMISASRAYEMNISMMDTAKKLIQRTLQLGQ